MLVKVCCVAEELGDDVNEVTDDEEISENVANLNSLMKSMSSSFFADPELPS